MTDFRTRAEAARERIRPFIRETPLVRSSWLSRLAGSEVYFKCEHMQHTRAFKVRGALNKVLSMDRDEVRNKTLVTASGGNHGLAVAYTAKLLNLRSRIVLPESTPRLKIDAIRELGGEVEIFGAAWDEANQKAIGIGASPDSLYIHPFDDERVIEGQATVACEIVRRMEDVSLVMASIGGGGLISGVSAYLKSFNPSIRIAGVETVGADSMHQSVAAGRLVTLPAITSKAESLGAKRVSKRTLEAVRLNTDQLYVIADDRAEAMQKRLYNEEAHVVELAASCVIAAFLGHEVSNMRGRKAVIILCGGNASMASGRE